MICRVGNKNDTSTTTPGEPDTLGSDAARATAETPAQAASEAAASQPDRPVPGPNPRDDDRPHGSIKALTLAALGIVFGDIGTSPLYSLQTTFSADHNAVAATPSHAYGIVSLVFWTITLIVTVKYVAFILRADNDGEGGILALVALLRDRIGDTGTTAKVVMALGLVGAALFYGDSLITPAISVLSAVEGLTLSNPGFAPWAMPIAVVILTALFIGQRFGTEKVGRAFGPVMVLWFIVLAILGIPHIANRPEVITGLLPHHAVIFIVSEPLIAFIAMGAVVLTITGAEALYADMGHFGARPIRIAWFYVVFPALVLNYLGQAALILENPGAATSPFFSLAPGWARIPLVVLATIATVIASQAVISGAYSVSRQAVRLGLLPRLTVKHTSKVEGGQIYVPAINGVLYVGVMVLLLAFESSERLASAYGLAVTGTLLLTSALFLILAHHCWGWTWWQLTLFGVVIGGAELTYFGANLTKVAHGGWLPLLIAGIVLLVMTTWMRGRRLVTDRRECREGRLTDFLAEVERNKVPRVPGLAVFPHANLGTTPLALRSNLDFNKVLHERIVIMQIINENVPHIRHVDRVSVDELECPDDGIVAVTVRIGFNDSQDIPRALALAAPKITEFDVNEEEARYFLSSITVEAAQDGWRHWRRALFVALSANSANRTKIFHLPPERTVVVGARIAM